MEIVPLRPDNAVDDPTIIYYPSCTRVQRCSGCCSHKLLSCQPTIVEKKTFQVTKAQYTGGTKLTYKGKELIIVEEHKKCKCGCAIQDRDCNQFQKYDASQCKCYCTNLADQTKCLKVCWTFFLLLILFKNNRFFFCGLQDSDIKIWDNSCTCQCKEVKDCTTGSHFDHNLCQCIEVNISGFFFVNLFLLGLSFKV